MEKKISITEALGKQSNYSYFEGLKWNLDRTSVIRPANEVEREFLIGADIVKSDLYLAEIVAKLSFADASMILEELALMKKNPKYKDVNLPQYKTDAVKRGLQRLAYNGLVRCFSYTAYDKKSKMQIYCISEVGLHLIKKVLYSNVRTEDTLLSLEPVEEAFRRLAASYCVQVLRKRYGITDVWFGKKSYVPPNGRQYIYGQCEYRKDDRTHVLLIEPIYFRNDKSIVNPRRIESHAEFRMQVLDSYIDKMNEQRNNLDIEILFLVEDQAGLKKATTIALQKSRFIRNMLPNDLKDKLDDEENVEEINFSAFPSIGEHVVFSSEPLLYYAKGEEFLNLRMKKDGTTYHFGKAAPEWSKNEE